MSDVARPAPAAPAGPPDEISLRELYLVLRRRAPWIVAGALVAGLIAFAALSLRPPSYVAEATAIVSRAPISVQLGTGLSFRPEIDLTFDTYQTLAFSRSVLEAVLPFAPANDVVRLRDTLSLERVAGLPNQPSSVLAVVHRVRGRDPALAAAAADAWAGATIATARRLLLENLDAVELITGEGLAQARAALETAEAELEAFRGASAIASLRTQVGYTGRGPTGGEGHVPGTLDQAIDALEADLRRNRIAGQQVAAEITSLEARAGQDGDDLLVVLYAAPTVTLPLAGAIASLEAQALALAAEGRAIGEELDGLFQARAAAGAALADATAAMARLERAVAAPRAAVESLAAIEPSVAYVAQVAPSGARVLSESVVPSVPEPSRRGLVALLAAVVVAFVGVVLALLAEAVRDPRTSGA